MTATATQENPIIKVKFAVDSLRELLISIVQMAQTLANYPSHEGFLVLINPSITEARLSEEWHKTEAILHRGIASRLTICFEHEGTFYGIPQNPDQKWQQNLEEAVAKERQEAGTPPVSVDYTSVIVKILLYCRFRGDEAVTADWLRRTAGCSYPTVARVLKELGDLIERRSDLRVRLRYFPEEEFLRLRVQSGKFRAAVRFSDQSGQPRTPEVYLHRLEKLNLPDLAVGGVFGARHYFPALDLVGSPRLDLSRHSPGRKANLSFIRKLDPALKEEGDRQKPATVTVHVVHHADSLFVQRGPDGLFWADPVECLLDLYEAHLDAQAAQFLQHLEQNRNHPHEF